jgi:demethylmenaquinone methyltransferase/2-methoxy-6-polyprenyl-1,4-benzoquinol methylase
MFCIMKADYSENFTPASGLRSETGTEIPSRREIWRMFDHIAGRYDLLNRLLSFRQDVRWRKRLAEMLPDRSSLAVLDLATGTADVLLSLFRYSGKVRAGIGLDMAENMLKIGRRKVRQKHLETSVILLPGDAVRIPFAAESFDVITIAFGIRNVQDVPAALQEMLRILKPGGRLLILEFSLPKNCCFRFLYLFYFRHILPKIGGLISGDRQAYGYLNKTVETFPYGQDFCRLMIDTGFRNVRDFPLTLGISSIYRGDKNSKIPHNQD